MVLDNWRATCRTLKKMVPMSHYLQKWTQNWSKWPLLKAGNWDLKRQLQEEKTRAVIFLDGAYKAQETKAKCEKQNFRRHPSTKLLNRNENHHQSQKRRWQTSCQLFVLIQRISQCLTAESIVSMSSVGCTFAIPSLRLVDGGSSGRKEAMCSWRGKRRRRWTQSEGESGWLSVPLIEQRLHILYCRVAHRVKWRQRTRKLGCGLRSRI